MNGHLPSPGCSHSILQPSSKWSPIFQKDGHQPFPGWSRSPTIQNLVTYQHEEGCPLSSGGSPTLRRIWSHTLPMMITQQQYKSHHNPQDCYHFPQHSQLDLEFESSAAKLVNLVVILDQLVPLSVALPAQLVSTVTDLILMKL